MLRNPQRWTSFFWSRRRDWEQAFGSLYYGLISRKGGGGCGGGKGGGHREGGLAEEGFYLQCPMYTVLWRLVREGGEGEAEAAGADGRANSGGTSSRGSGSNSGGRCVCAPRRVFF